MHSVEGDQEGHDGCGAQSHIPGGTQEEVHETAHEGRVEAVLWGKAGKIERGPQCPLHTQTHPLHCAVTVGEGGFVLPHATGLGKP